MGFIGLVQTHAEPEVAEKWVWVEQHHTEEDRPKERYNLLNGVCKLSGPRNGSYEGMVVFVKPCVQRVMMKQTVRPIKHKKVEKFCERKRRKDPLQLAQLFMVFNSEDVVTQVEVGVRDIEEGRCCQHALERFLPHLSVAGRWVRHCLGAVELVLLQGVGHIQIVGKPTADDIKNNVRQARARSEDHCFVEAERSEPCSEGDER